MAKKSAPASFKNRKTAASIKKPASEPIPKHPEGQETNSIKSNVASSKKTLHIPDYDKEPRISWNAFVKVTKVFVVVKALLYVLVALTPMAYDTSSLTYGEGMLFETDGSGTLFGSVGGHFLRKLTIWDNVFFVDAAARDGSFFDGYEFERKNVSEPVVEIESREPKTAAKNNEEPQEEEGTKYKDISQYSFFDSFDSLFSAWTSNSNKPTSEWPQLKTSAGVAYTSVSQYVYEHEWAFGTGWIYFIKLTGSILIKVAITVNEFKHAFLAAYANMDVHNVGENKYYFALGSIWLSNLYHFFACLVLFSFTATIYNSVNKPPAIRSYEYLVDAESETLTATKENASSEQQPTKAVGSSTAVDISTTSATEPEKNTDANQSVPQSQKTPQTLRAEKLGLTAALLFAMSPAGIFLGAGYSESLFAFLSFFGFSLVSDQKYLASALFFAISTSVRSNGLIWLSFYLHDFLLTLRCLYYTMIKPRSDISKKSLRIYGQLFRQSLLKIVQGAFLIVSTFLVFQYLAYAEYCPGAEWCPLYIEKVSSSGSVVKKFNLPLIYSYIQRKYWNVGFLKYWTPNNIPNFLFALPTLYLIVVSNLYFYKQSGLKNVASASLEQKQSHMASTYMGGYLVASWIIFFASLLVWNTQIVTRVASCLPTIYWYVAELLNSSDPKKVKSGKRIATFFFVWIATQSVLFGAFMPPA